MLLVKATYQTRIETNSAAVDALSAYARLYGHVERRLFAAGAAGESSVALKRDYLAKHGIPSRLFNSVRVSLESRVKSVQASQKLRIDDLERRIRKAEKVLARLEKRGLRFQAHQKKRRLSILREDLERLRADVKAGRVRLCFGGKKLWRSQYDLEANGYGNHAEWLEDWQDARNSEFFVMGSRDETAGCQLCVATVQDDGSVTLRLRLSDSLVSEHGRYVVFGNVWFNHGHGQVLAALARNVKGSPGQAISYRFKRDVKGWRVFVTTEMQDMPVLTDPRSGAVGVDLNVDHLAVCETDAQGNPVHAFSVPLVTYGKSAEQAKALIGDAVARVVAHAKSVGKPVVLEKLDFRRKKSDLRGESPKHCRMLSSFSYGKVLTSFQSRGFREGVGIHQVNPAFSSVIGRVKFMERYGLSQHQAAALVMARRLLGFSERVPCRKTITCLAAGGGRVTFRAPVRKRGKHAGCGVGLRRRTRSAPSWGGTRSGASGRDSRTRAALCSWGGGHGTCLLSLVLSEKVDLARFV